MSKDPQAYQTIGEASRALSIPTHVLRFWETKFSALKPRKGPGGRRYYRPQDMDMLFKIRHLLQEEGYTLKGAQKRLVEKSEDAGVAATEKPSIRDTAPDAPKPDPPAPTLTQATASLRDYAARDDLHALMDQARRQLDKARQYV